MSKRMTNGDDNNHLPPCYVADDLVLGSGVSPECCIFSAICKHFQLTFSFFVLAANCCMLLLNVGQTHRQNVLVSLFHHAS